MKKIYEFDYFTDEFRWSLTAPRKLVDNKKSNNFRTTIMLPEDSPNLKQVIDWTAHHTSKLILSRVIKSYSEKELSSAQYLFFNHISWAPGEMFSEDFGTKFNKIKELKNPINSDKVLRIQEDNSKLICDTRKLLKRQDIQSLLSNEIVISKQLGLELEKNKISGYKTNPVYCLNKVNNSFVIDSDWSQLVINSQPVDINSETIFGLPNIDFEENNQKIKPLIIEGIIPGVSPDSELILDKNIKKNDFSITTQRVFDLYPYNLVIFSQKVYKLLKGFNIGDSIIEPVKLK